MRPSPVARRFAQQSGYTSNKTSPPRGPGYDGLAKEVLARPRDRVDTQEEPEFQKITSPHHEETIGILQNPGPAPGSISRNPFFFTASKKGKPRQ